MSGFRLAAAIVIQKLKPLSGVLIYSLGMATGMIAMANIHNSEKPTQAELNTQRNSANMIENQRCLDNHMKPEITEDGLIFCSPDWGKWTIREYLDSELGKQVIAEKSGEALKKEFPADGMPRRSELPVKPKPKASEDFLFERASKRTE